MLNEFSIGFDTEMLCSVQPAPLSCVILWMWPQTTRAQGTNMSALECANLLSTTEHSPNSP